jgi:hypothetical protein
MRDRGDLAVAAAEEEEEFTSVAVAAEFRMPWEAGHHISAVAAHRISAAEAECTSAAHLMSVAGQL